MYKFIILSLTLFTKSTGFVDPSPIHKCSFKFMAADAQMLGLVVPSSSTNAAVVCCSHPHLQMLRFVIPWFVVPSSFTNAADAQMLGLVVHSSSTNAAEVCC